MRSAIAIAVLVTALAVPAATQGQEFERAVIDSFDGPDERPFGVDWVQDLGVMYLVDEWTSQLYSVTPEGQATLLFNIIDSLGIEPGPDAGNAVCYVPGSGAREASIFIGDYGGATGFPYHDAVYEFTLDGSLLNNWDVDAQCGSGGLSGLAHDGTDFWLNCGYYIVKCDGDFNALDSFVNPGAGGIATQGGLDYDTVLDLLYVIQYYPGDVYVVNPSDYSTLGSFPAPTEDACGMTIGRPIEGRGRSLWTTSRATGRVYEIEDEYGTPVLTMSWGTVKALYR
jgi:hypothetical protein